LNSIGLENPGIAIFIEKELPRLRNLGPAVIANLAGGAMEEYVDGAALLNESAVDMIELNISCPNVKAGGMAFGLDPLAAAQLVAAVRKACGAKPRMVKLSPNAPDPAAVAIACVKAGADALSLVNTFKGMAIDVKNRRPVFEHTSAGLSGPAIKPVALRMVWELYDALRHAKAEIPIVGMGGVACVEDALEFLMAGAAAIQVGSATFARPSAMIDIIEGIEEYMRKTGMSNPGEISIRR
jgi:dihydroorotate dehydrogenase (NAD+) catalytic subunit